MARIRTIKPSFFLNDELADLPLAARLGFAGLWCLADREGRMEDRPTRIKAQVFPYDAIDMDAVLQQLADAGFIIRYAVDDAPLLQVSNFVKHQAPHSREAASILPPPSKHDLGRAEASPFPAGREGKGRERTMDHGKGEGQDALTREHAHENDDEDDVFELTIEASPPMDGPGLPEASAEGEALQEKVSAPPPVPARLSEPPLLTAPVAPTGLQPAPKPTPRRHPCSEEFEAFWKTRRWSGDKRVAYKRWVDAGLDKDPAKREAVMAAVAAQLADRERMPSKAAGGWYADWKHAEGWLSGERWNDPLRYENVIQHPASTPETQAAAAAWWG